MFFTLPASDGILLAGGARPRAEARDFADVYPLASTFDKDTLVLRAAEIDTGFDRRMLAVMVDSLSRFADDEIPIEGREVAGLREFFADWAQELRRPSADGGAGEQLG